MYVRVLVCMCWRVCSFMCALNGRRQDSYATVLPGVCMCVLWAELCAVCISVWVSMPVLAPFDTIGRTCDEAGPSSMLEPAQIIKIPRVVQGLASRVRTCCAVMCHVQVLICWRRTPASVAQWQVVFGPVGSVESLA